VRLEAAHEGVIMPYLGCGCKPGGGGVYLASLGC